MVHFHRVLSRSWIYLHFVSGGNYSQIIILILGEAVPRLINGYLMMALVSVTSILEYFVTRRVSRRLASKKGLIKEEMVQANNEVMEKIDSGSKEKLEDFEVFWQKKLAETRDIDVIKVKLNRGFTGTFVLLVSSFLFALMDIFSKRSLAEFYGMIIYPIHASCMFLLISCCIYVHKIRSYGKYTRATVQKTETLEEEAEEADEPVQDPPQEAPVETYQVPMN
jgi:hypothetical protein